MPCRGPGCGSAGGAGVHGRGLYSFRFQLNLSSSVHRVTQLNPECVLELLKLSSNVNECKPLVHGAGAAQQPAAVRVRGVVRHDGRGAGGRGLHSSTLQLNVSTFCPNVVGCLLVSVTKTAQVEQRCGRV